MNINTWELMIPIAFLGGTGIRVSNELGAKFATVVAVLNSSVIGILFACLGLVFHDKYGLLFTSSEVVLNIVDNNLSVLLAFTILLNSIQPVLSVNIGSYYLIGVPVGILLGCMIDLEVEGLWAGMIVGTLVQTLILAFFTARCDWENEAIKASARITKWDVPELIRTG